MTCLFTKVFGERNTGATYLEKLVSKNFATDLLRGDFGVDKRVLRLVLQQHKPKLRPAENNRLRDKYHERILYSDFGLKHAAPPIDVIRAAPHSENTLFLLITKHPVFFLSSLHNRPENPLWNHNDLEFDKFITTEWPISERDNVGDKPLDSPIELWNQKMRDYVRLMSAADNVLHIRYEDLLSDFETQLDRIADYVPKITAGYGMIRRSIKASDNLRFEDYVRRYKYHKIKTDHKKRDLEFIYRKTDDEVMNALGYRKVL
ncbi:MAG: sulfotransferase [Rhodobacteraceae bacterium]|nr:sulfotransferase [Paracoccaceae bacterium]